jgi:hypothetical protein
MKCRAMPSVKRDLFVGFAKSRGKYLGGFATLMFDACRVADAAAYGNQQNHFLKNVASFGALSMVACTGVGPACSAVWPIERQ